MIRGEEKPLSAWLKDYMRMHRMEHKLDEYCIKGDWNKIVGNTVAKYTKDVKLIGNVLFIYTLSAPMKVNLLYAKEDIINLVNKHLGKDLITNVEIL